MHAYLFVDEHPYYTLTDGEGRFELSRVPPGEYDVVAWLPSWREARHDRDPETGNMLRFYFKPPVERTTTVSLPRQATAEATLSFAYGMFPK